MNLAANHSVQVQILDDLSLSGRFVSSSSDSFLCLKNLESVHVSHMLTLAGMKSDFESIWFIWLDRHHLARLKERELRRSSRVARQMRRGMLINRTKVPHFIDQSPLRAVQICLCHVGSLGKHHVGTFPQIPKARSRLWKLHKQSAFLSAWDNSVIYST